MSAHIHHGPWINWSHGLIAGATVTLGEREGGLLTAFIATFVTIVGAELWKIICYVSHQLRSKHGPQDGLYHQQQVIFRTSPTPGGAAWLFLQQTFSWAGRARLSLLRTLPWALFGAIYIGAIGLIAVFSSEISKSPGPARLIISDSSDNCGIWSLNKSSTYSSEAFSIKSTNDRYAQSTTEDLPLMQLVSQLRHMLRRVMATAPTPWIVAGSLCPHYPGLSNRMRHVLSNQAHASTAILQPTR